MCVCMYVHVQVCHFGSLLTICVPGVRGYLSIYLYLSIYRQGPRLPRKSHRQSGGDQGTPEGHRRDTGAYIRPLCSAPSPTPATHKPPAERRRPRDTGGTPGRSSDPFAVHQVLHLPRKSHRQSGGDQGTPEGHRRDTGSYIRPLCSAPSPACHAKATDRRDTGAYIRPLCSAPSLTPATQKPPAERRRPRDTGGTPIRPLCKSHRQSGGDQGTPEGHRGVHPTPLQCTKSHLPRKSHRQSGGDQGTPEGHWGVHLE